MAYKRAGWAITERKQTNGFVLIEARRRFADHAIEYCPVGRTDKLLVYKDLDERLALYE